MLAHALVIFSTRFVTIAILCCRLHHEKVYTNQLWCL